MEKAFVPQPVLVNQFAVTISFVISETSNVSVTAGVTVFPETLYFISPEVTSVYPTGKISLSALAVFFVVVIHANIRASSRGQKFS